MRKVSILFLFMMFTPLLGVAAQEVAPSADIAQVQNIINQVEEKTPNIIQKPFVAFSNAVESFRINTLEKIKSRQAKLKNLITNPGAELSQDEKNEDSKEEVLPAEPEEEVIPQKGEFKSAWVEFRETFKYLEIFLLAFLVFVFSIKFVFYGLAIFLIFLISRFIWYRFY